jgi:hypothetical protein
MLWWQNQRESSKWLKMPAGRLVWAWLAERGDERLLRLTGITGGLINSAFSRSENEELWIKSLTLTICLLSNAPYPDPHKLMKTVDLALPKFCEIT